MTQWIERAVDTALEAEHLRFGRNPLMCRLLAQRNITPGNVDIFFAPQLDYINWEDSLPGSRAAAKLLLSVMKQKGRVAVIGDYDVDGVTSSAMIQLLCRDLGIECHVFLPSRLEHGYGLNPKTVPAFIESVGKPPDLLIAADCGTSSEPELEALRKFGAKRIAIIDHHIEDPARFSASADCIVNWRQGKNIERQEMCTAGEVFVLAKILEKMLDRDLTSELLPLAAIGTVADISPITGLNRIIVKNGLARVGRVQKPGLKMLLEKCGLDENGISQTDISFKLAPRLNATGRMGKPNPSYDLLVGDDPVRAAELLDELEACNVERKLLLNQITEEAVEMANQRKFKNGILLINPTWHVGIIGVVASRVSERFLLPSIIMGQAGKTVKGSGRSLDGVNLKAIMDTCSDLFSAYGGHEMAAGATLKAGLEWDVAAQRFDDACGKYFESNPRPSSDLYYDAELPPSMVGARFCNRLRETFYPYHKLTNPEPVFLMKQVQVNRTRFNEGDTWKLMSFEGRVDKFGTLPLWFKSFNVDHHDIVEGQTVDVLFTCAQSWDQRYGPSLQIVGIRPSAGFEDTVAV